jgi:hypothetical protein
VIRQVCLKAWPKIVDLNQSRLFETNIRN